MRPFEVVELNRFESDFSLVPKIAYTPTTDENSYLAVLTRVTEALSHDVGDDPSGSESAAKALAQERRSRRRTAAAELRSQAQDFIQDQLEANIAADNALVIKGKYVGELQRLADSLFLVVEDIDPQSKLARDLLVRVAPDLPPPNDVPSPEKQALYVALSGAQTVIQSVSQRIEERANRPWRRWLLQSSRESERAKLLLDQYLRKLAGIGRLGLQGPHVQLASLALDGLRNEFVAREAGRIKNTYVRSLGMAAGFAALLCFGSYALVVNGLLLTGEFWAQYKVFLLAAGGAAIGTWLSFSIRRVTLSFNELGILEEDLLDPSVRVIFVVLLTLTVCLLFWTEAINIEIGNLKTSGLRRPEPNISIGAVSVLVGVFCGIAERTLATAISGRSAAFVRGLAGGG